ncbi:hypothetical protein J1605_016211 [Eschrichtius robustus]|uniref:Uncharacterized protein n=1 Tax=Eschrichtius robustus TaxID=9764 RepID=A0AB34G879_ESCRO|nr:hypothetical protein J1605_016211 [Eschrichtius robustus]
MLQGCKSTMLQGCKSHFIPTPGIWLLITDFVKTAFQVSPAPISVDPGDDFFLSVGSLSHPVHKNCTTAKESLEPTLYTACSLPILTYYLLLAIEAIEVPSTLLR